MAKHDHTNINLDWHGAQNDAQYAPEHLLELVRFLARCAAERDAKQQPTDMQERQGTDD